MKTIGLSIIIVGAIWGAFAFNMKTTVETESQTVNTGLYSTLIPSQTVHNLPLANKQRNHLIGSGVLLIAGVLLFGFGSLMHQNVAKDDISEQRWQQLQKTFCLDANSRHISIGFAVGVFISFIPVFGLHTILAIVLALALRINMLSCVIGTCANTSLTAVPALAASYNLGRFIRGKEAKQVTFENLDWQSLQPYAKSIFIGSPIIGIVIAVVAYFICYGIVTFSKSLYLKRGRL